VVSLEETETYRNLRSNVTKYFNTFKKANAMPENESGKKLNYERVQSKCAEPMRIYILPWRLGGAAL